MLILDSVGFAATHTITSILKEVPNSYVSHGSRNFRTLAPLGAENTSLDEFTDAMREKKAEGLECFAVHSIFNPREAKSMCLVKGIDYKVLVRRPEKQIGSCFAWAMKKLLEGDPGMYLKSVEILQKFVLPGGIAASLSNVVYTFAAAHVLEFNLAALGSGAEIVRMEELVSDKKKFCDAVKIPESTCLSHFDEEGVHMASHKSKVSDGLISDPDIEAIQSVLKPQINGQEMTWEEFSARLGYS